MSVGVMKDYKLKRKKTKNHGFALKKRKQLAS